MKVLKWLLLLPPAILPYLPFFWSSADGGFLSAYMKWFGVALGCSLVVYFTRSRWDVRELSRAICVVKLVQILVMTRYIYAILFLPPMYYLYFLPSCMVGISAVLQCREEGILPTKKAVLYGVLQFLFIADVVSAVILYRKVKQSKEVTP